MIASRHQNEGVAQKGREIFERRIVPILSPDQEGHLAVIDTVTGEFEISPDDVQGVLKLSQRVMPGKFYFVRVGHSTPYRLGTIVSRANA